MSNQACHWFGDNIDQDRTQLIKCHGSVNGESHLAMPERDPIIEELARVWEGEWVIWQ
jgi:hypothetical protein